MILTDARGRPFERPRREDYPDSTAYLRAYWAYGFQAVTGALP